jgi:hypothetical protein
MANIRAISSGNWSNNAIWSPAPPTSVDDVFASGFTIYVDQNIQVLSINTIGATGIGGGGVFIPNNGTVMTTNVVAGSTTCINFLSASPNSFSLIGFVSGGNTTSIYGINNNSTGAVNITGNIFGGTGSSARGIFNLSTGIINVVGDVIGGTASNSQGIINNGNGIVTVFGNVSGSALAANNANAHGISNTGTTALLNVVGNCIAGRNQANHSVSNGGTTSTINITGFCFGSRYFGNPGSSHGVLNSGSGGTVTIYGGCFGGTVPSAYGAQNQSTGTITVFGSVSSYSGTNSWGILADAGTINVVGEVRGGQGTSAAGIRQGANTTVNLTGNCYAFNVFLSEPTLTVNGAGGHGIENNSATARTNITGNVFGGTRSDAYGVSNNTTGTVGINGNAIGGFFSDCDGVRNVSTGTILISGNAVGGAGSAAYGARNASTGILRVKRAVGNDWGLGYTTALGSTPGVFSSVVGSQTFVEELQLGPRGQWPTGGIIYFTPNSKAVSVFETDTFQNYSLIQSNSADNLLPPVSSVRQGTTYNLGLSTGTCIIPPASSVGFGVPVDNTTGTATLIPTNVWNISSQEITDNQSIGGRLKNTLTANAAERLVNSFNFS